MCTSCNTRVIIYVYNSFYIFQASMYDNDNQGLSWMSFDVVGYQTPSPLILYIYIFFKITKLIYLKLCRERWIAKY